MSADTILIPRLYCHHIPIMTMSQNKSDTFDNGMKIAHFSISNFPHTKWFESLFEFYFFPRHQNMLLLVWHFIKPHKINDDSVVCQSQIAIFHSSSLEWRSGKKVSLGKSIKKTTFLAIKTFNFFFYLKIFQECDK